ncbi:MAG: type II toxin-antitoxin system HicB family antitoxin [Calditrichaeota bacterium]|nr:type II toxin-antitoxin system HicB family antitoxin [Calditrichota bacterium]
MQTLDYSFYEDDGWLVGWLLDYPDYQTQGESIEELEENLRDIFDDITDGYIPHVRRIGHLTIQ